MTDDDRIRFNCSNCGKTIKVPSGQAGKRGRCPGCQESVTVPSLKKQETLIENDDDWINSLPPPVSSPVQTSTYQADPGWAGKPLWLRAMLIDEWAAVSAFGFVFIWVMVLLRIMGLDLLLLLDRKSTASPLSLTGYFYLALGFSVILIPLGLIRFLRSYSILSRGIVVPGWIEKSGIGFVGQYGSGRKVTIGYEFEGSTYTIAITDRLFKKFEEKLGVKPTEFVVIVDPKKPRRALVDERVINNN